MSQDERTDSYKLREERLHKKEFLLENFQINPYLLHLEEGFKATEENNSRSQSEHLWTEFKANRLLSQEFKEKFEKCNLKHYELVDKNKFYFLEYAYFSTSIILHS